MPSNLSDWEKTDLKGQVAMATNTSIHIDIIKNLFKHKKTNVQLYKNMVPYKQCLQNSLGSILCKI